MGMFDSYNGVIEDIPCNLFKPLPIEKPNVIITGVPNINIINIPFEYDDENMGNFEVIYKQYSRMLLKVHNIEIEPHDCGFYVIVKLNEEESNLFGRNYLNTFAQVKFNLGDKIMLSELIPTKILHALDSEEN